MNRPRLLSLITALSMTSLPLLSAASADTPVDRRQLERLLLQDCGSCHGLRLTGGLGPAITPEALAGKPRNSLIATVTHGRPGTAMPGWNALLNDGEITWLVDRLLQGNP